MDDITRVLASLTTQGWETVEQTHTWVKLTKPYPHRRKLYSWDIGVMIASVLIGCVAYQLPPRGAILLGLVSVGGLIWGVISMHMWQYPIQALTFTHDKQAGGWRRHGHTLERG